MQPRFEARCFFPSDSEPTRAMETCSHIAAAQLICLLLAGSEIDDLKKDVERARTHVVIPASRPDRDNESESTDTATILSRVSFLAESDRHALAHPLPPAIPAPTAPGRDGVPPSGGLSTLILRCASRSLAAQSRSARSSSTVVLVALDDDSSPPSSCWIHSLCGCGFAGEAEP